MLCLLNADVAFSEQVSALPQRIHPSTRPRGFAMDQFSALSLNNTVAGLPSELICTAERLFRWWDE